MRSCSGLMTHCKGHLGIVSSPTPPHLTPGRGVRYPLRSGITVQAWKRILTWIA